MVTEQEIRMAMVVSTHLGIHGACLADMEPAIDDTIKIISSQRDEDPENAMIPIMMNLLVAAKDLINAHRTIERVAELTMSGGMHQKGPESVQ